MTAIALEAYEPGLPVTLLCCTTPADIYYHGPAEGGRVPIRPSPDVQLRAIPYQLAGHIAGMQYGEVDYLILRYEGSAPKLTQFTGGLRVAGSERKERLLHVPITAIRKISVGQ